MPRLKHTAWSTTTVIFRQDDYWFLQHCPREPNPMYIPLLDKLATTLFNKITRPYLSSYARVICVESRVLMANRSEGAAVITVPF